MISGLFVGNTPFIRVAIGSRHSIQVPFVVLDTGFTGDIQVTPEIAKELKLKVAGITSFRIADGKVIQMPTAVGFAAMESIVNHIKIFISDGLPLAGINFLSKFGYKATVNGKYKTVVLEKVT